MIDNPEPTIDIGRRLARAEPPQLFARRLEDKLVDWLLSDQRFKTQVFRLVDVYPALRSTADRFDHLYSYLHVEAAPRSVRMGLRLASRSDLGRRGAVRILDTSISRMARRFIAGSTPEEALPTLSELWSEGTAPILDLLGEVTVTDRDAERYGTRVDEYLTAVASRMASWPPQDHLVTDHHGPLPRLSVAIKPTALSARYHPLSSDVGIAEAAARIRPILRSAIRHDVFIWFDMEYYAVRDLTVRLFKMLLNEPEFASVNAGIVVQAYLRDSMTQLEDIIEFAGSRSHPIGVRLVKGAYWDTETVEAAAHGWPSPVYAEKAETDANYEACTSVLNAAFKTVRPAYASHNLRSVANAIADAQRQKLPDNALEFQMLYGMGDDLRRATNQLGARTRFYAPVGELIPGMAYLVRRLLENTSNESFLRQS
ncbi:MAG: proline dehydrogenase family protein, partial [Acidimicrobiia bacterium]|nr:proline dehydrogenase family protein [Acidimicrobiia bacterium]NNL27609.1 L-glutamate gamma-semialdehyde dehydrogenase [Acidimicrobiia bacterium]